MDQFPRFVTFFPRNENSDGQDGDGKWAVRDNVWIHYLDRKGKLTAGFGVKEDRIGPELGFGWVAGDAF